MKQTEFIDQSLIDLDLRSTSDIMTELLSSQANAFKAVEAAQSALSDAVDQAADRLSESDGRLVLVGAGASGRIAVQDGAELWPTYGWPAERLELCMAGGKGALINSIEGVEDNAEAATEEIMQLGINKQDVVVALAASGESPWTCQWIEVSRTLGALTIGIANNAGTRLLDSAACPVYLNSGSEVLAGSTRMTAGTAQKITLNLFSTALMIRLNRTYGNLMVDMAAVNQKLDQRRIRLLQGVLPELDADSASKALAQSGGWVKLAALVALGESPVTAQALLEQVNGSLRNAIAKREQSSQTSETEER